MSGRFEPSERSSALLNAQFERIRAEREQNKGIVRDGLHYLWNSFVEPKEIDNLRISVGWRAHGDRWREIIRRSTATVIVRDEIKNRGLVGFSRMVDDGLYCTIWDTVVHPDYQGQGVLSSMLELSQERLDFASRELSLVALFPAEGTENMYAHLGAVPVQAMRLPQLEQQS